MIDARIDELASWVEAGVLRPADVAFAALVDEAIGPAKVRNRPTILLAAALASRAPRFGHVCLDPRSIEASVAVDSRDPERLSELDWPDPERWLADLKAPALGGVIEQAQALPFDSVDEWERPLVLDRDLLYLHRYHRYETRVQHYLSGAGGLLPPPERLDEVLDVLFEQPGRQRDAARRALTSQLTVIAGGPGTGKTYTLARVLAAFHMTHVGDTTLNVALAAPTGKAAARMTEAIREAMATLPLPPDLSFLRTGAEARTLHRLLGYTDGIRFRHGLDRPLTEDVVVIDEVSMVSLPLMARLLEAAAIGTRLVLVGDPNQLASVEAGAVLGEITRGIPDAVVELDRTHRYGDQSEIGRLAEAVRTGDAETALSILHEGGTVQCLDPESTGDRQRILDLLVDAATDVMDAARDGDAARALAAASRRKILCGTRYGPNGLHVWQRNIEAGLLRDRSGRGARGDWYVGRPVLVTKNDYLLNLFNGDTGVVVAGSRGERTVVFDPAPDAERFDPAQLGPIETWWAMTIHKSQGSEFDHVILSLPDGASPVLTRELLYTGITRARERVTILGAADDLRQAIERPIQRASGLARSLAATATVG